jgi:hypothetical protein
MTFILDDTAEVIEIGGITFTFRQDDYLDVLMAYKKAREGLRAKELISDSAEVTSFEDRMMLARAAAFFMVVSRITGWSGVKYPDGTDAECSDENKLKFFGRNPNGVEDLMSKLGRKEEEEVKNSETSQGG